MRVGIIDYGVGNLGSVFRAVEELRVTPVLIDRAVDLHAADCLILPGVGNFADCMQLLTAGGWPDAIREEVAGFGKPMLGVCLGMQLLAHHSHEGAAENETVPGLGLVPGQVVHLRTLGCELRVPHVGWNEIVTTDSSGHLFAGIPDHTDFYFVHSYAFIADDPRVVLATTDYGTAITAAVGLGHVWGTQFHPEKSSRAGLRLLGNFVAGPTC